MTDDLLDLIRDERDRAIELLRQIEEEDLTLHEARGDGPTRDVTKKRAGRQRQIIERMERLLAALGAEALAD